VAAMERLTYSLPEVRITTEPTALISMSSAKLTCQLVVKVLHANCPVHIPSKIADCAQMALVTTIISISQTNHSKPFDLLPMSVA
jgi:hypothetical protein